MKRKWNSVSDQSNVNYDADAGNEVICIVEVLKANLRNWNDAHILVRGDIVTKTHSISAQVALKSWAPFTECITKIDGRAIDDTEDLDLAMSVFNLMEYNSNYSETIRSSWYYSKDKGTYFNTDANDINFNANYINLNSLKLKGRLLGNTEAE